MPPVLSGQRADFAGLIACGSMNYALGMDFEWDESKKVIVALPSAVSTLHSQHGAGTGQTAQSSLTPHVHQPRRFFPDPDMPRYAGVG